MEVGRTNLLDKRKGQHFMKKILCYFPFVGYFLLSGCWDRVEVNDLAIVTAAGFDQKGQSNRTISPNVYS